MTCEEIAAYCDCSREAIQQIEQRALLKLRKLLRRAGYSKKSLAFLVPDQSGDAVKKKPVETV
jgi:hypothetical protein